MPETAVVTILFTDLVSSTALSQRLGEDATEDLRREHFAILRRAIERNRGREVKNLGDGVMAVFARPSDAVSCGVAIQQAVERREGEPIGVRVGVHTGEAVADAEDYFGTAVVVAQRLCAAASGGEVLSSAVTRELVGSRGAHEFESRGAIALKGIDAPMDAYTVLWTPAPAMSDDAEQDARTLPALVERASSVPIVGRDPELDELDAARVRAAAGETVLVLIAGEPGIGKTRLAAELCARAHAGGATVLAGRSDEASLVPFQPFVEALAGLVASRSGRELARLAGPWGGDLARLVPQLGDKVPDLRPPMRSDPESERYRLFEATAGMLHGAAGDGTLVLLLDDLHWADAASLQLLRHVLRGARERVLVVATYRDTELGRTHPLSQVMGDLRREAATVRIALDGVGADAVRTILGAASDDALVSAVRETTDGNPFFVHEIGRHITESGDATEIPEGVKDVVGRRLSRLSEGTERVLQAASVAGPEFRLDVLARASDMSEDELLDALDAAEHARIVAPGPTAATYVFTHALVRRTLYDELSTARRVRTHRRLAGILEELGGADAEIAHHLIEAGQASDAERAATFALRAAQQATRMLAHDEAASLYRSALQIAEPAPAALRGTLLTGLGESLWRTGDHEPSVEAFREALRIAVDAPVVAAHAALGLAGPPEALQAQHTLESIPALARGVEALRGVDEPLRIRAMARLSELYADVGQVEPWQRLSRESLGAARALGDAGLLGYVLRCTMVAGPLGPDGVEARLAMCLEMIDAGEQANDAELTAFGEGWRFLTLVQAGEMDEARLQLAKTGHIAEELHVSFMRSSAAMWRAGLMLLEGRFADAEAAIPEWAAGLAPQDRDAAVAAHLYLIARARGQLAPLAPLLETFEASSQDDRTPLAALAYLYAVSGEPDRARDAVDQVVAALDAREDSLRGRGPLPPTLIAYAAGELDYAPGAEAALRWLAPWRGEQLMLGGLVMLGAADLPLAIASRVLGRIDEASTLFESAMEFNKRIRAWPWLAETRYEYARLLVACGDASRARELARQALDAAHDMGMTTLEQGAAALVESTG